MGRFIFYVKVDKRPFPPPFDRIALGKGKGIHTIERDWHDSKERRLMLSMVGRNSEVQAVLNKWEARRKSE
jgi:hypothetical protein